MYKKWLEKNQGQSQEQKKVKLKKAGVTAMFKK